MAQWLEYVFGMGRGMTSYRGWYMNNDLKKL